MRKRVFRSIVWRTAVRVLVDVVRFAAVAVRSQSQLAAENLFLRKQLALYRERPVKPRRADDATRITLVMLAHLIDWRAVLTIVKPDTLIRWHRKGFRLFWRWKSRAPGRPPLPPDVQQLIAGRPPRVDHMRALVRVFPTCRQTGSHSQMGITSPPATA